MIISVQNLVSGRTGEGLVQLEIDGQLVGQFEAEEARKIAHDLAECAAVAECEAMLVRFLRQRIGLTLEQAATVLIDFRQQRG